MPRTVSLSRLVLFDLGGVVCQFTHERRLASLADLSGLSQSDVHQRVFASGFDLDCDRGLYSLDELQAELCSRLEIQSGLTELIDCWAPAFSPVPEMLDLVRRVREQAIVGILTNNGPLVDMMLRERFPQLVACFDQVCFSYQARATKPAPRAYLATLERLMFAPDQSFFVDDGDQNVVGAQAVGMDAIRFTSAAALESALVERGLV